MYRLFIYILIPLIVIDVILYNKLKINNRFKYRSVLAFWVSSYKDIFNWFINLRYISLK